MKDVLMVIRFDRGVANIRVVNGKFSFNACHDYVIHGSYEVKDQTISIKGRRTRHVGLSDRPVEINSCGYKSFDSHLDLIHESEKIEEVDDGFLWIKKKIRKTGSYALKKKEDFELKTESFTLLME